MALESARMSMPFVSLPPASNGRAKADAPCITVLIRNLPPVFTCLGADEMLAQHYLMLLVLLPVHGDNTSSLHSLLCCVLGVGHHST